MKAASAPSPPVHPAPTSPALYLVELFGPLTVRSLSDVPRVLTRFRTAKTGALLAFLAFHADRRHMREVLADRFWPDRAPSAGRATLSVSLSALRSLLEPPGIAPGSVIVADGTSVGLNPLAITTDVARFEALLDRAEGTLDPDQRADLLRQAVVLHHHSLLPGHYDEWIVPQQERLAERQQGALLWLTQYCYEQGAFGEALSHARRLPAPDEEADALIEQIDAAIRKADRTAAAVAAAVPPAAPAPSPAVLTPPIQAAVPAPDTPELSEMAVVTPPTRFVGRADELEALLRWAAAPTADAAQADAARLVTLTGAGGAGKTRLAREMVHRARAADLPIRFFAADLTAVPHVAYLPDAVAAALGLEVAEGSATPTAQLAAALGRVTAPLLLLDNVEQLLPHAAAWIEEMIARVPRLRCLVTSRVVLQAAGERVVEVDPLPVPAAVASPDAPGAPDPESLLREWPSVALFVDRAQSSRPNFRLTARNTAAVARLVTALDGIPLAIELAAARSRVLSPADMLAGMEEHRRFEILSRRPRGSNDRHSSLRDTLAWSVDLLAPEQRRRFARLSVFRGGCTLAQADAVMGDRSAVSDLSLLCDTSLVRSEYVESPDRGETVRFTLLETVREFAAELLAEYGPEEEADAAKRHAELFEALAVEARPHLRGGADQAGWITRLRPEHDNLQAAVGRALAADPAAHPGEARRALTLTWSLHPYWRARGMLAVGRDCLSAAVSRPRRNALADEADAPTLLLRPLAALGTLALAQEDLAEARLRLRQALWLTRRHPGPDPLLARRRAFDLRHNLSMTAAAGGRWEEAERWLDGCLSFWQEVGDRRREGDVFGALGIIASERGRLDDAQTHLEAAIRLARETGNVDGEGVHLVNLGQVLHARGGLDEWDEAEALYLQGLRRLQSLGVAHERATALLQLGLLRAARGPEHWESAAWLLSSGEDALRRAGVPARPFIRAEYERLGITPDFPPRPAPLSLDEATERALSRGGVAAGTLYKNRPAVSAAPPKT
jgi:predicted ATPase/DNA-binding SARP family transcriptional activator